MTGRSLTLDRIITWCVSNPLLVCVLAAALTLGGVWAMRQTPVDAIPDISDVQVIVSSEWAGHSPELVEDQITYPIVSALVSAPKVKSVRGLTEFGISQVYVIFEDGTDLYWARSRVTEFLQGIRSSMPDGVEPLLGPDATGVGWVFEYALTDPSGRHGLDELRSLQDWTVRASLASVTGVAQVATIGGFVRQYQITLDPARLAAYGLAPKQIVDAVRASNNDVESRMLEFAGREYIVRARGSLKSVADIEDVALGTDGRGTPIRVGDVARVGFGPDLRRNVADLDGRGEVVGGIVIMRVGENALSVINRVKERLAELQRGLPDGVRIVTTYDRSGLILDSLTTIRRALLEEMLVVSLVVILFLSHARSIAVLLVSLPVAVVAAFLPMWYFGVTANIMSLGGIALAIGVVVDASIVMVENGYRHVMEAGPGVRRRREAVLAAARQVGRPVLFSLAIVIVSFIPVFMLEAQEGRMFRPLALTKTCVIAAGTLLAVGLVPALMAMFMAGGRAGGTPMNWVTRRCTAAYEPLLRLALRRRSWSLWLNAAVVPLTVVLFLSMGREFLPPLYEGSLLYMPTAAPGLSIGEAGRLLQKQDQVLRGFPEVERVFGTVGRANSPTDNSSMGMVNTTITLKPRAEWRPGLTLERLQAEMDDALRFPGVPNVWTQPIRGRLDMLFTGIKTPLGIKILGPDLAVITELGRQIESIVKTVPGTHSVYAESTGQEHFIDIRIDRAAIARYGMTLRDVQDTIQASIGGENVTRTIEGRERYPVNVRYARELREDLPSLGRVLVKVPSGAQVPLAQLATMALTTGPAMIRDENGRIAGYVYVIPEGRDLQEYVASARRTVESQLKLPPGYALEWAGQYEFQNRAAARLLVLVPLVLAVIFVLLVAMFRSLTEAMAVMLSVVYAMTGGVVLQWMLGYTLAVAAWVGYIALFGVAIQTGVVMLVYLHEALDRRTRESGALTEQELYEAVVEGSVLRLRPKLMTVVTMVVSLLPILWSSGVGSDVMKPMAAPIVGGMLTSAVHVLIVTPVVFFVMKRRALRIEGLLAASGRRPRKVGSGLD